MFNISRRNGYDIFGFKVDSKKVTIICSIKSVSNNIGLCTLQGLGGAGLFYVNNSTLKINGFTLSNGGSKDHSAGGAIYQTNKSHVELVDTIIKDSRAKDGGGMGTNNYTKDTEARLFRDASNNNYELIVLSNTQFIGNKAFNGGAILASNALISGTNVKFIQNEGSRIGGAIGIYSNCTAHLNDTVFDNNYARGFGGAVYTDGNAQATFIRPRFLRNAAGLVRTTYLYKLNIHKYFFVCLYVELFLFHLIDLLWNNRTTRVLSLI